MSAETIDEKYKVEIKDGKIRVVDVNSDVNYDMNTFWTEVISRLYAIIEETESDKVDDDHSTYDILREKLANGVVYRGKTFMRNFSDQKYDFLVSFEDDKLTVRQIDGAPLRKYDLYGNIFWLTNIKSNRLKQLEHGAKQIKSGVPPSRVLEQEVKDGILVNGINFTEGELTGNMSRRRRR